MESLYLWSSRFDWRPVPDKPKYTRNQTWFFCQLLQSLTTLATALASKHLDPLIKSFFFPPSSRVLFLFRLERERIVVDRTGSRTASVRYLSPFPGKKKKRKRETKININISPTAVHDSKREGVPYPFGKEKEKKTYVPIAKTPAFVGKRELRESGS